MSFLGMVGALAMTIFVSAIVLLIQSIRTKNLKHLILAILLFLLIATGYFLLLRFITCM